MGKRSDFKRIPRDFYPTPLEAAEPLFSHLPRNFTFIEPCAGDGALVDHITKNTAGRCILKADIAPKRQDIAQQNVMGSLDKPDFYITNPPWDRKILHPIIELLSSLAPTWLLFDADWPHTQQSAPYMEYLEKIVSIGRVKWIPDSKMTGKDNCCWYLFDKKNYKQTMFFGRNT
mgnify:FL=1|jgi:hypothetical protein